MLDDEAEEPAVKQSPATSSGLSSPVSVTASVRSGVLSIKTNSATRDAAQESSDESPTVATRRETSHEVPESSDDALTPRTKSETRREARQSYGDFMSYYVADGDDDDEEAGEAEEAEEEAIPTLKPNRKFVRAKPAAKEKQPRQPRKKQASTPLRTSVSPVTLHPSPAVRTSKKPSIRQYPPRQKVRFPSAKPMGNHGLPHATPLETVINQRAQPVQHATHQPNGRQLPKGMQQHHGTHQSNGTHVKQPPQAVQPPKPVPYTLLAEVITVKYHAPVDVKVKKLQALSASLTVFGGGAPPPRKTPAPENKKMPENEKKLENVQTKQDETKEAKSNGQFQTTFIKTRVLTLYPRQRSPC
jgi:hypothetical protein